MDNISPKQRNTVINCCIVVAKNGAMDTANVTEIVRPTVTVVIRTLCFRLYIIYDWNFKVANAIHKLVRLYLVNHS